LFLPDFRGDFAGGSLLAVADLIADVTGLSSAAIDDTVRETEDETLLGCSSPSTT
jgi:hypothetical protein